jgi:hypothetical protein
MSILLAAMLLAAQQTAPAEAAAPAAPPAQTAKKQKPKQVCEYLEITGSRAKQRVCHDVGGAANLEAYGVSNSGFGKASIKNADQQNAPSPGAN